VSKSKKLIIKKLAKKKKSCQEIVKKEKKLSESCQQVFKKLSKSCKKLQKNVKKAKTVFPHLVAWVRVGHGMPHGKVFVSLSALSYFK
jgi:uncharacterized protein YaaN involved in tellurite resistance